MPAAILLVTITIIIKYTSRFKNSFIHGIVESALFGESACFVEFCRIFIGTDEAIIDSYCPQQGE